MWPSRASIPIAATAPSTVTSLRPHFPVRPGPRLGFFPGSRLAQPRCLAVDVDHTLLVNGQPHPAVVNLLRERVGDGWELLIWSMRGREHAERAARLAGLDGVAICASKPGCVVDDQGLDWLRQVELVKVAYVEA